jgi:NAD(P)-dependent dehydrogenase (short-subunit alcohol dehydrogenase family)
MGKVDGKVAIVTGGATGLGRAIAAVYAREGAKVVVADVRPDEAQETMRAIADVGGEGSFVECDVTDGTAVEALVAHAVKTFGTLNIVTANAGILGRGSHKSLIDMTDDEFHQIMNVNFYGAYHCFKHAIPELQRAGGGTMTATTSLAAHRGYAKLPAYCASKGALVALVRSLAADLAPHIRVNAVSAGPMKTEIAKHMLEDKGENAADAEAGQLRQEPSGRADPDEVARVHLFLASEDSSFINGQAVLVDGGQSIFSALA